MSPRAGLDRCGKSRPNQDSIPGPSSPQPVPILTELPALRFFHDVSLNSKRTCMFRLQSLKVLNLHQIWCLRNSQNVQNYVVTLIPPNHINIGVLISP